MSLELEIEAAVRRVAAEMILPALERMMAKQAPAAPAPYLTTQEAARLVQVRPETVRAWVSGGELASHGHGKVLRIRRDELEAFMARRAKGESEEVDLDQRAREIIVAGRIGKARSAK